MRYVKLDQLSEGDTIMSGKGLALVARFQGDSVIAVTREGKGSIVVVRPNSSGRFLTR